MSDTVDLMAAKLEALKRHHEALLFQELFRPIAVAPVRPLTKRARLARARLRVQAYVSILWRALKGEDPYDVEGDD